MVFERWIQLEASHLKEFAGFNINSNPKSTTTSSGRKLRMFHILC